MTPKLRDGDYCFDERGRLLEAEGDEELMERAILRLKAKKGCFPLDPALGSELWQVDLNRAELAEIEPLLIEALAPLPEVRYTGAEISVEPESSRLVLTVYLQINGKDGAVELTTPDTATEEETE